MDLQPSTQKSHEVSDEAAAPRLSGFIKTAGNILAISYPVLAFSTGARAAYQLFLKEGVTNYLGPILSAVAAFSYLIATIGFTTRRRWAWRLSVVILTVETVCTFVVGTLSIFYPELIGRTVWRYFGIDYGFFPLIQPLLGLAWLFHPDILRAYGIRPDQSVTSNQ